MLTLNARPCRTARAGDGRSRAERAGPAHARVGRVEPPPGRQALRRPARVRLRSNTGQPGYTSFNRYYFAQQDRKGAIIDERFNGGGSAADYIIEVLQRDFDGYFNNAAGDRYPFTSPAAGIWGPKVMVINEMAGSGGDLMPFMFKRRKIGPLVGTRTWGGLVHTADTPPLVDGGSMIAPRGGFFTRDGKWGGGERGRRTRHRSRELPEGRDRGQGPAARARRGGSTAPPQGEPRGPRHEGAAAADVGVRKK